MGHEYVGIVEELGSEAANVRPCQFEYVRIPNAHGTLVATDEPR